MIGKDFDNDSDDEFQNNFEKLLISNNKINSQKSVFIKHNKKLTEYCKDKPEPYEHKFNFNFKFQKISFDESKERE